MIPLLKKQTRPYLKAENDSYQVPLLDVPFWIENGWKYSECEQFMVKGNQKVKISDK